MKPQVDITARIMLAPSRRRIPRADPSRGKPGSTGIPGTRTGTRRIMPSPRPKESRAAAGHRPGALRRDRGEDEEAEQKDSGADRAADANWTAASIDRFRRFFPFPSEIYRQLMSRN